MRGRINVHSRINVAVVVMLFLLQDVFSDSPMDYSRSLSYNLRLWTDLIWERVPNSLEPTEQEEKEGQECEKKFPQCALTDFKKVLGTNE